MPAPSTFRRHIRRQVDAHVRTALTLADEHPGARAAYERLLLTLRARTTLLRAHRDAWPLLSINGYLYSLAKQHADWLRPPEAWSAASGAAWPALASLAEHLFALYPMPPCLASAWLVERPERERAWYLHLARGGSPRTLDVPLSLTRAMGHHFRAAPAHLTPTAALRWAQVRGLGGDESLANAVATTHLGIDFGDEAFWRTVLHFFVRQPPFDRCHVDPIIDFVRCQRFGDEGGHVAGLGILPSQPANPHYTLKGRTIPSLVRQAEAWRSFRTRAVIGSRYVWPPSSLRPYEYTERTEEEPRTRHWTIRELLSSRELLVEGQALRHCVAIYDWSCYRRFCFLWSLRVDVGEGPRRCLTVEVDAESRTICQARGKANRQPREREWAVLRRWAAREGLQVADVL